MVEKTEKLKPSQTRLKLNLGSASKTIEGYVNVDVRDLEGVDLVWDLTNTPYPFEESSVDQIRTEETLEHISWRKIDKVLKEWYRILKPGCEVYIQVPDIGEMCENYVNGEICNCVPHKAGYPNEFKPDPDCPFCHGKGRVNTKRWFISFVGSQKHPWDVHRMIFTEEIMEKKLEKAGFVNIFIRPNRPYKIKVTAEKPKL